MKIHFAKFEIPESGALAVGALDDRKLQASATALDKAAKGALIRALGVSRFKGRSDDLLQLLAPGDLPLSRVLLFGLGQATAVDALAAQAIGGRLTAYANGTGDSALAIAIDAIPGAALSPAEMAANVAFGARLRSYRFDKYRTKEKPEQKPSLKKLTLLVEDPNAAKKLFEPLDRLADGVVFTRDLVSEPANVIYPESLAEQAKTLEDLGVKVEILGEKEMKKLGMNALLGVGQGSARESQLVGMQW
jgi:leucyl aminopeptidase